MIKSKRYVQISRPGQTNRRSVSVGEHPEYRLHDTVSETKPSNKQTLYLLLSIVIIIGLAIWRAQTASLYENKLKTERDAHNALVKEFEQRLGRLTNPQLRTIATNDLPLVYERSNLEGTILPTSDTTIFGDVEADSYIRTLAGEQGYTKQPVANVLLAGVDGFSLQVEAAKGWLDLKTAASRDNVGLMITSAYRSPDEQRILFLQRLGVSAANAGLITNGSLDEKINETFKVTSPPGYSRHHSGFALDLADRKDQSAKFENTAAYKWISDNNYLNARLHGWVPSYPKGALKQGPEPEAWEFVYVGVQALAQ